jgi:geranylgeranyl reductase family protein
MTVLAERGMWDVAVVGGGPAGLIAARSLAAAGHQTLVLEEHAAIGQPVHCTGVLGLDAFRELDLPARTIRTISRSAIFRTAGGEGLLVETDHVRAAIVDRGAFDEALAAQAVTAGATIRCGVRVTSIETGEDGVRIGTAARALQARACVLACGASYRFNRQLGLGVPRAFVQSAQAEQAFPASPHIEVHLGRTIAPGGFAWVVPFTRDGAPYARIGLMCQTRAGEHFDRFRARMYDERDATPAREAERRLKILPLAPVSRTCTRRLVAVGDAAGLVKPTTGGGIYYSLLSGALAAEVLDGALRSDTLGERALRAYEAAWRGRLGPEIRAGLAFRAIASRLSDSAIHALVELARVDGLIPLLKKHADFNWHRASALALLKNPAFRRIVLASWFT